MYNAIIMIVNNPELLPNIGNTLKKVAKFVGRLLTPLPESGYYSNHIRHEEPQDGLFTHEGHIPGTIPSSSEQPELWEGLPYYKPHHTKDGFVANRNETDLGWEK